MSNLLVSACLLGQKVRYDGQAKTLVHQHLEDLKTAGRVVPFCPELAGGLPVPRLPAEIEPGFNGDDVLAGRARVLELQGEDVTAAFIAGAMLAVKLAHDRGCNAALLTEASPSCGSALLYSGHHDGVRRDGFGVTTAALREAGVSVFAPTQIKELAAHLAG